MKPYSQDLRARIVRACDERLGTSGPTAELFGVSTAWIRRLLQRRRQTGSFAARPTPAALRPRWAPAAAGVWPSSSPSSPTPPWPGGGTGRQPASTSAPPPAP